MKENRGGRIEKDTRKKNSNRLINVPKNLLQGIIIICLFRSYILRLYRRPFHSLILFITLSTVYRGRYWYSRLIWSKSRYSTNTNKKDGNARRQDDLRMWMRIETDWSQKEDHGRMTDNLSKIHLFKVLTRLNCLS